MAVVLPVFLLLLLRILQCGIVFNNYMTLTDAVRAGARTAAVSRHRADRVAHTEAKVEASAASLEESQLGIDVDSSWEPGEDVSVTATYPYEISLLGLVVKSGELESSSVERVE